MFTKDTAKAFADHWLAAWNSHDLSKVLDHYTDDFEMSTPFIVSLMNEPSGTLKGKDKVGAYWAHALTRFPDLHFELIDVLFSVDSVVIYYRSVANKKAAELFIFNDKGKVVKAIGHYDQ